MHTSSLGNLHLMKRSVATFVLITFLLSCANNQQPTGEETNDVQKGRELVTQIDEYSNGFSPMINGWKFPNYAPDRNGSFTLEDAVALFGEKAICGNVDKSCLPSPATLEWINFINVATQGGVCEGMTVFSASRFLLQNSPQTIDLSLDSEVGTAINRLFATQFLDEVIDQTETWQRSSVDDIVNELMISLSDVSHEQYTLGIYTDVSGHSLLPYAIEINNDGTGTIWVYDPNWPKQERYIDFDIEEDSWRYAYFGANQELDNQKWEGTGQTLDITPLSSREKPFTIPFPTDQSSSRNFLAISSIDDNWTVTTEDGEVLDGKSLSVTNDFVYHNYRSQNSENGGTKLNTVILEWLGDISFTVNSEGTWIRAFRAENTGVVIIEGKATGEMRFSDSDRSEITINTERETTSEIRLSNSTDRVFSKVRPDENHRLTLSNARAILRINESTNQSFELNIPTENRRRDILVNLNRDLIELQVPEYNKGNVEQSEASTVASDVVRSGDNEEAATPDHRRGQRLAIQPSRPSLWGHHGNSQHDVFPVRVHWLL